MRHALNLTSRWPLYIKSLGHSSFRYRNERCKYSTEAQAPEYAGKSSLEDLLRTFEAPVSYAFGYGSGVFSQGAKQHTKSTQVDLILAVDNPAEWHAININQNPEHYSGLKYIGSDGIAWVQENLGAGVYFNPFVTINSRSVKYGVVGLKTLRDDLLEWRTLYLAGRLHKPVRIIRSNESIERAQQQNLSAALSIALLLLPDRFSERDLYMKLAGVSYMGDVRMALAENPNKVRNIVNNQFHLFRRLYRDLAESHGLALSSAEHVGPAAAGVPMEQSLEKAAKLKLLDSLPETFRSQLPESIIDDPRARNKIAAVVRSTIKGPSFTQSLKGLLSAGLVRSTVYSFQKLQKRWS